MQSLRSGCRRRYSQPRSCHPPQTYSPLAFFVACSPLSVRGCDRAGVQCEHSDMPRNWRRHRSSYSPPETRKPDVGIRSPSRAHPEPIQSPSRAHPELPVAADATVPRGRDSRSGKAEGSGLDGATPAAMIARRVCLGGSCAPQSRRPRGAAAAGLPATTRLQISHLLPGITRPSSGPVRSYQK